LLDGCTLTAARHDYSFVASSTGFAAYVSDVEFVLQVRRSLV